MSDDSNRRFSATTLRLVVFALHGLLVVGASRNHAFIPDEGAYVELAHSIADDGTYRLTAPSF